jgi:VanZ family protein
MPRFLTLALALIIAILTLMPMPPGPVGISWLDKLSHFLAFGALAVPLSWRYPAQWRAVALAVIAYGGAIEIVQPHVGRSAEWADLLADALGAFAGAWLAARRGRARHAG